MRVKDDKVTIKARFELNEDHAVTFPAAFKEYQEHHDAEFAVVDGKLVVVSIPGYWIFRLNLVDLKENEKIALDEIGKMKDKAPLQLSYELSEDTVTISFYITRLSDLDIAMNIFRKNSILDIDPKVLVGLFLDNRFHG